MNILAFAKFIIPKPARKFIREIINHRMRQIKEPRMIWGYLDSTGAVRTRTRISDTVFMYHPEGIRIEDNVFVWHYTILDGTGGLEIGEGTQVGAWVGIFTHSSHIAIRIYGDHYQEIPENEKKGYPIAGVRIGKFVFIGAGAKILPGVTIEDGSIVSAGAIVNSDVNKFQIVSGNPAKVIGDTRNLDKQYLKDPQLHGWYEEWQRR
jgi:acetyltransferase-like isoleucine patch superfamily enzyme